MVRFEQLTRQTKIPKADYVFSESADLEELLCKLTPKIAREPWLILLIDTDLAYVRRYMQDAEIVPKFVTCTFYLPPDKMEVLSEQFPNINVHRESIWDLYLGIVHSLNHLVHTNAYSYLYKCIGPNLEELTVALNQLDNECDTDTITLQDVKRNYLLTKRVYASQVLETFYGKKPDRWKLYQAYVEELGIRVAYYAMRKQVVSLLKAKNEYLCNRETKNKLVNSIDAPFICFAYSAFMKYESAYQLPAIMHLMDNRSTSGPMNW